MKKFLNIISYSVLFMAIILLWQLICYKQIVPNFMLPSPIEVSKAFINNFNLLMNNAGVSLLEAFLGILISIILAFIISILMDRYNFIYKFFYPILVITQTIPTIAIAPLLVLWMGYGIAPKIALIVLVCFFPITISMLGGFKTADVDSINLLKAMGASKWQIFKIIKLPYSLNGLMSGLKISISYAFVGAVIAEWLGGNKGLGVYMIRAKKSYSYDEMFAIILLIIIISLLAIGIVSVLERRMLKWKYLKKEK